MQLSGAYSVSHPYKTPPNPPPRKYGRAYHNPSMVETDEMSEYPTPAPRSSSRAPHPPILRSDSSKYPLGGTGPSLSHLHADHSLSPPVEYQEYHNPPPTNRRYTSSTPEQNPPSGASMDRSMGSEPHQSSSGTPLSSKDTGSSIKDNYRMSSNSLSHESQSESVFLSPQHLPSDHSMVNRLHNRTFESTNNSNNASTVSNARYRLNTYNGTNGSQTDTLRSILKDRSYSDGTRVQHEVQITTPSQYEPSISGIPDAFTIPVPYHKQNGMLSPNREDGTPNHSLHSLELSRISNYNNNASNLQSNTNNLSITPPSQNVPLSQDELGVRHNLVNIFALAVLSLLMSGISLQLVLRLSTMVSPSDQFLLDSVFSRSSHSNTWEVCVCLCALVLMLDLSCLMVCAVQAFFALKLLKSLDGYTRTYKYLQGCGSTRFVAVTGFFISIPVLLLACLLFVLLEFRATPAIISTVITIVGMIFLTVSVTHSAISWRLEKNKADKDIPAYGSVPLSKNELSTLV